MKADRAKGSVGSNEGTNPSAQTVISTEREEKRVEDRVAINAQVVYETIRREGEEELVRSNAALAWLALSAGLSMGISFIAEALLKAHLPKQPWAPLVYCFGYSVGFLLIVLGRQQLFTENTLTVILPLMQRRNGQTLMRVLQLWTVVLSANPLGTCLFAACVGKIALFDPAVVRALAEIGAAHTGLPFAIAFVRAIFAGWLIALMVWLPRGQIPHALASSSFSPTLLGLGDSITSWQARPLCSSWSGRILPVGESTFCAFLFLRCWGIS